MSKPRKKKRQPKRVLALPDLEQSKAAVLNSLTTGWVSNRKARRPRSSALAGAIARPLAPKAGSIRADHVPELASFPICRPYDARP